MNIALESLPDQLYKSLQSGSPVWIFGAGSFGRAVARACFKRDIAVAGFVQTKPTSPVADGKPVRSLNELTPSDRAMPLLMGVFNRDIPLDGLGLLVGDAGLKHVLMPWHLHALFEKELGWRYWLQSPEFLAEHSSDLNRIQERLADDTSRECLKRLVQFRLGKNLGYASFSDPEPQYFNDLTLSTLRSKPFTYVDGGAYHGDSLRALMEHGVSLDRTLLFEPDPGNYSKLTREVRSADIQSICLPLALSDRYQLQRFSGGQGEAAHLSLEGDCTIATVALDDVLFGQKVDFIKLDVEGSEADALKGAKETLRTQRPVLAISCYHKPEDLWSLPDLIDSLVSDYRLHFRQHAFNSFDLVLYGIPSEKSSQS